MGLRLSFELGNIEVTRSTGDPVSLQEVDEGQKLEAQFWVRGLGSGQESQKKKDLVLFLLQNGHLLLVVSTVVQTGGPNPGALPRMGLIRGGP